MSSVTPHRSEGRSRCLSAQDGCNRATAQMRRAAVATILARSNRRSVQSAVLREVRNEALVPFVIIVLLSILAGAVFVGHYGWVSAGDVVMPAWAG